jgi:hypothetical protein
MEWTHHVPPWRIITAAKRALTGDYSGLPERQRQRLAAVSVHHFSAIGFKRLFRSSNKWLLHPRLAPALAVDRFAAHLQWLRRDTEVRIVHVVREDNIAWLRSKTLSDATGSYSGARYPDELRLSIPVGVARRRVRAKMWIDKHLATLCTTNPYIRVNYEDFVAQNLAVARKLAAFLGCDPELLPATELVHQVQSRASRATILNTDELRDSLGPLARF